MPKTLRQEKANSFLKNLVAEAIGREIDLPANCLLTVTAVDISPDLLQATISLSVLPFSEQAAVLGQVIRRKKIIQKEIAQKFKSRHTPLLRFVSDDKQEKASKIISLLDEI